MKLRLAATTAMIATLALAGCATTSPGYGPSYGSSAPYPSSSTSCYDCGTVTRIDMVQRGSTVPNRTGAVLGGIVGAVAGHEISDKTGGSKGNQNIAAVAGAVGGAVAGNAIQNRVQASSTYNVYVRMNDGRTVTVTQSDLGGIREGSSVRVNGGRASLR